MLRGLPGLRPGLKPLFGVISSRSLGDLAPPHAEAVEELDKPACAGGGGRARQEQF